MKSKNYIESDYYVIKNREFSMRKHIEKLIKISQRSTSIPDLKPQVRPKLSVRTKEIERENELLFGKLEQILKRPCKSTGVMQTRSKTFEWKQKRRAEKIAQENELFTKRISEITPMISLRSHKIDYESHKQALNRLSRKKFMKLTYSTNNLLPPLKKPYIR